MARIAWNQLPGHTVDPQTGKVYAPSGEFTGYIDHQIQAQLMSNEAYNPPAVASNGYDLQRDFYGPGKHALLDVGAGRPPAELPPDTTYLGPAETQAVLARAEKEASTGLSNKIGNAIGASIPLALTAAGVGAAGGFSGLFSGAEGVTSSSASGVAPTQVGGVAYEVPASGISEVLTGPIDYGGSFLSSPYSVPAAATSAASVPALTFPAGALGGAEIAGAAASSGVGLEVAVQAAKAAASSAGDKSSDGWLKYMPALGAGAALLGAGGALSNKSTTTKDVPGKSAAEIEAELIALQRLKRQDELESLLLPAQKKALDLSIAQLEQMQARQATLDQSFTPEQEAEYLRQERERNSRISAGLEELNTLQLEAIKRGGRATPEQLAIINEATAAAQKTGEADIERFRTATLRQINEEVASASGLRPTDTPVVRLSERAGEEAARQHGILTSRLAETNATARLNYPLAQQKLVSDITATQEGVARSAAEFNAELNRRAQENRNRLFASPSNFNSGGSGAAGFASSLAAERLGSATTTTNAGLGLAGLGKLAGGVGGLLQGLRLFS